MKLPTLLLAIALGLTSLPSRLLAATVEDGLIAGAKKEGALVLYLSTNLADANGLVQLYQIQISLRQRRNVPRRQRKAA